MKYKLDWEYGCKRGLRRELDICLGYYKGEKMFMITRAFLPYPKFEDRGAFHVEGLLVNREFGAMCLEHARQRANFFEKSRLVVYPDGRNFDTAVNEMIKKAETHFNNLMDKIYDDTIISRSEDPILNADINGRC